VRPRVAPPDPETAPAPGEEVPGAGLGVGGISPGSPGAWGAVRAGIGGVRACPAAGGPSSQIRAGRSLRGEPAASPRRELRRGGQRRVRRWRPAFGFGYGERFRSSGCDSGSVCPRNDCEQNACRDLRFRML